MDERWQEVERIYHAARELDKSARGEFPPTMRSRALVDIATVFSNLARSASLLSAQGVPEGAGV